MKIDKEDYKLLESALNSYRQMMSNDEDDEQDNSKEIEVCKKYIKLINKPVETTNEQPIDKALSILKKEEERRLCLKAYICPECGGKIIPFHYNGEKADFKTGYNYIACEKNKKHYCDSSSDVIDEDLGW